VGACRADHAALTLLTSDERSVGVVRLRTKRHEVCSASFWNALMFRSFVVINLLPSSLILFTLIIEVILSSETSVLTRATRHHIQEDGILHSHRCEISNLT
jgi:hypothetical protein